MHLDEYLRSQPRGASARIAEIAGITDAAISRIRRDLYWPSRDTWQKISEATAGRVSPNDHLYGPTPTENANGETTTSNREQSAL